MRIGTITFYEREDNYGCILQCFALPCFLKSMGHEAFFIKNKYEHNGSSASILSRILGIFRRCFFHPYKAYKTYMENKEVLALIKRRELQFKKHPRYFDQFTSQYIPSTDKIYTQFELLASPPKADAFVCGSDQIWGGENPAMYLKFAPKGVKKIAYAASFGGLIPSSKTKAYIKECISDFDLITIREKDGVMYCKEELGREDAVLVPDPTLLLTIDDYKKSLGIVDTKTKSEEPYIFLYLLGNTMTVETNEIMDFASRHGLDVKYVASGGREDEYFKEYPQVIDWLKMINDASFVITNSFHGTVFSLLFRKQFVTIPLDKAYKRMNVRISSLLESIQLENRIYKDNFDVLFDNIDFECFELYQSNEINRVKTMLNTVLKK